MILHAHMEPNSISRSVIEFFYLLQEELTADTGLNLEHRDMEKKKQNLVMLLD